MTIQTPIRYLSTIFLALLLVACGSSRKGIPTESYTPSRGITWHDLSVPINVSITQPKRMSIGGTMTMVNGESTTISLRFLGMEVGAAHITTDTLYAYSKLQKVYVAESLRDALAGLGLTLGDLQALLTGQPFHAFTSLAALSAGGGEMDIEATTLDTTGQPLSLSVKQPNSGRQASIRFTPLGNDMPLASALDLSVTIPSNKSAIPTQVAATIAYSWDRATIDAGISSRSFSIPSSYRRISGSALLKALTSM